LRWKRIVRSLTFALVIAAGWISQPGLKATAGLPASDPAKLLRAQAERAEQDADWLRAAGFYEQLLLGDRRSSEFRDHYQNCLRRARQTERLQDPSYRHQIEMLSLDSALKVYAEVLTKLQHAYVARQRVAFPYLFREGIRELDNALSDPSFTRNYVHGSSESLVQFQDRLHAGWEDYSLARREDLQAHARALALSAQESLGFSPSLIVMELACGACAGLDEYTRYVTPGQVIESDLAARGQYVGVGIELAGRDQKPVVESVLAGSPAEANGVRAGDRLVRVNDRRNLTSAQAAEALGGEINTSVEIELAGPEPRTRVVRLRRQELGVRSVSEPRFVDEQLGVAYLRIASFSESTGQEVDVALTKLEAAGMRALILDLRGNNGGLFDVAVLVAERFLSSGIIAFTRGESDESNVTYRARAMSTLTVPLVVLIDSDTASSAEMIAGALKENHRGTLVGETTFGKGSIQKVRKLHSVPAAIRMTVAKFYSPQGHSYLDAGVVPDVPVDRAVNAEQDPQLQAALDIARPLIVGP
jgi:carboxyl-terminal processing protease